MNPRTSVVVSVLLVLAAASAVFAGMLAMGIITFAGPAPTGTPIARPSVQPTPLATGQPTDEPIPTPAASPTPEPSPTEAPTGGPQPTAGGTYVVQEGDSLFLIGERFGVSWTLIAEANALEEPYTIFPGQQLIIPAPDAQVSPDPEDEFYIVQAGDTLTDIAYKLGISAALLADVNGIEDWNDIEVGQQLIIPGRGPADSPTPEP